MTLLMTSIPEAGGDLVHYYRYTLFIFFIFPAYI